jgi:choline dehydrogenase-like flavoprotein
MICKNMKRDIKFRSSSVSTASSSSNFNYGYPTPGPQNPTAQKIMDHLFFLSEAGWKQAREEGRFDFVVIGSGFCALAFTERMLRHDPNSRILIIERGPFFLPEHFQNLPLPFQQTLGGLTETFPWSLSSRTASQPPGRISWVHGIVPFFGGRSLMWSAWCPRPTRAEMADWPEETILAAERNFDDAERLLNVVPADRIDAVLDNSSLTLASKRRPIYGTLQRALQDALAKNLDHVDTATSCLAAPIAVGAGVQEDLDFAKFSTPAPLLDLVIRQAKLARNLRGQPLSIVTDCAVSRILQQDGVATAIQTSRGIFNLGGAKLILGMGALPPATLILNSFPQVARTGERFTAHFISSIVARMPKRNFPFAGKLAEMELAAIYLAGRTTESKLQYHVQLSVLSDSNPKQNSERAARYMPDVVATASLAQLTNSHDHLVFVCASLGELDCRNEHNWLRLNDHTDPTTNVLLQVIANDVDAATWDSMDEATFQMLERALSPVGAEGVEYWHGDANAGAWQMKRPVVEQRRAPALVHEASALWIGNDCAGVVGTDYRPHGVDNVYITGAGLWPTAGSWNPTLTMVALAQDLADRLKDQSHKAVTP